MNHAETIINLSAEHFGIPVELLSAKTRKREVVIARHTAMKMLKMFTALTLKQIGILLGNRDHTSVIHGLTAIEDMEDQNAWFAEKLFVLQEILLKYNFPVNHISESQPDQIDQEFKHLL